MLPSSIASSVVAILLAFHRQIHAFIRKSIREISMKTSVGRHKVSSMTREGITRVVTGSRVQGEETEEKSTLRQRWRRYRRPNDEEQAQTAADDEQQQEYQTEETALQFKDRMYR